MSGYVVTQPVACECGVIALHHLDCGDPCCGRCSHPDYVDGMGWTKPVLSAENNSGGPKITGHPDMVETGQPARVSVLKTGVVHQQHPWGRPEHGQP